MDKKLYDNYVKILENELVPALGCTEPIAIAYAAAKAREILGEFPDHVEMRCSGNIIKNVKGVTVPNSDGQKGIDVAAILGIVGGRWHPESDVRSVPADPPATVHNWIFPADNTDSPAPHSNPARL